MADNAIVERATQRALLRTGLRITQIDETTRAGVREVIRQAIADEVDGREAARRVREWGGWGEYRSEMIARTEMMNAYNQSALATYEEYGVASVVADDGDKDAECAARHGNVYGVDYATSIADHPNGTLDWLPVAPGYDARRVQEDLASVRPFEGATEAG